MIKPTVELILGDCLEVMRDMPDKSVDAVITDPPYLVTDLDFDDDLKFGWVSESLSLVNNNGYLCSFGYEQIQREIEHIWVARFSGVWIKEKGMMRTATAKMPKCQSEPYKVYAHPSHNISELTWNKVYIDGEPYRKVQRLKGYKRGGKDQIARASSNGFTEDGYVSKNNGNREVTDTIYGPTKGCMRHDERTDHPTQKPVKVMSVLVRWLTNEGDTILDPFMGSGTTGVACVQTGRNFIGIEIDPDYFTIAERRIKEAQMQLRLL